MEAKITNVETGLDDVTRVTVEFITDEKTVFTKIYGLGIDEDYDTLNPLIKADIQRLTTASVKGDSLRAKIGKAIDLK